MIQLDISGIPIPWKRAGLCKLSGNPVIYDRQKKEKEQTRWQMKAQYRESPLNVPILADITYYMPIPKGTSKKRVQQMCQGDIHHMKRPDIDNLNKYILDCMTGYMYVDDAQICELHSRKQYSLKPGTLVRLHAVTQNVPPEPIVDEDEDYYT